MDLQGSRPTRGVSVVAGTEKYNVNNVNEECTRSRYHRERQNPWASELYLVKPDGGVFRVKVKDDKIDPPVKILSIPPKKGDSWEIKSKVGTQLVTGKFVTKEINEKVTVPKGTFEAVFVEGVDFDVAGTKTTLKVWFVKGIGIAKADVQDSRKRIVAGTDELRGRKVVQSGWKKWGE